MEDLPGANLGEIWTATGSTARDRILTMFAQVAKSIRDPLARHIIAQAVQGCPDRDDWCEIQSIYWIFRNHGRYTGDVYEIDTYSTLRRTWILGIYDCDDATIGLMSLLLSAGYRTGAKIISQDGKSFGHVYAVVEWPRTGITRNNRRIIPLDATVPEAVPGWEPSKSQRKLEKIFWYRERGMA